MSGTEDAKKSDDASDEQVADRRDAVIRRMAATPPVPHKLNRKASGEAIPKKNERKPKCPDDPT